MDVYNDYLAFGSLTTDPSILGNSATIMNSVPYIAIISVSNGWKIYWAKWFPSKA